MTTIGYNELTEFNPNDVSELSKAVSGKTIVSVESDRSGMDDYLIFHFTDGTSLYIRYDYIYEYAVK